MEEYPDPDEEYELMYQEELEMIRQMDGTVLPTGGIGPRYTMKLSPPKYSNGSRPASVAQLANELVVLSSTAEDGEIEVRISIIESPSSLDVESNSLSSQTLNTHDATLSKEGNADPPLNGVGVPLSQEPTTLTDTILPSLLEEGKKRKVEDLFGDIADIEMEEFRNWLAKKKKTESVNQEEGIQDEDLIRKIIEGRKQAQERLRVGSIMGRSQQTSNGVSGATNMTRRVPKWPFLPLVAPGGERWFVRLRSEQFMEEQVGGVFCVLTLLGTSGERYFVWLQSEQFMEEQIDNIAVQGRTVGLLTLPYQTIWKTAQELVSSLAGDKLGTLQYS
uniref:Uncharacterized protein n=1 Tax=Timema shepardi TaxID=629360 RepID=A0A7R9G4K9_TIMSH|nr:unnamed protein product [Timema shepardi]